MVALSLFSCSERTEMQKLYNPDVTWWDEVVWFFEDLFESENDAKIQQLENRIKQLERKSKTDNSKAILDAINDLKMDLILLDD